MTWSVAAIRDGLKTRLETISGLRVYDTVPGQINPPAAVIAPAPGEFLAYNTSQMSDDLTFIVTLFVSAGWDRTAQDALDGYLARTGATSVKAAIEGGTIATGVDYATVTGARGYGLIEYAAVQYLGCEFVVDVAVE